MFTRTLAARYQGRVQRYEIWNEPNLPEFSYPQPSPPLMAQLQRSGYLGVKQGDPSALVVTGGVSRADVGFVSTLIDELTNCRVRRRAGPSLTKSEYTLTPMSGLPWSTPVVESTRANSARLMQTLAA